MKLDDAPGLLKAHRVLYPRMLYRLYALHKAMSLAGYLTDKRHLGVYRTIPQAGSWQILEGVRRGILHPVMKNLRTFCDKWSNKELQAVRSFIRG
jgi:hypothetical protein